jgi:hypothetical protein
MAFIKDLNLNIVQLIENCKCVGDGCCGGLPSQCGDERKRKRMRW